MNRRRKSGRDQSVPGDVGEEQAGEADEDSVVAQAVDMGTDGEPANLMPETPTSETPTSAAEPSGIFMDPLLPPEEALPTTILQPELSDYSGILPEDDPLLSYGSSLSEGVLTEVTAGPDDGGEVDIEISSQQSVAEGPAAEEHCIDGQEASNLSQQDISMVWGDAVSPVSTTDSIPSQSTSSSSSTITVPAPALGTSTSASHVQPQFQVPYYVPPPFPVPFTPGQAPFLVPGPYSPVSYARPPYTFGAAVPSPFQAFQFTPPPGQLGPYALRPYPYPPWGPFTGGTLEANCPDANAQAQGQTQTQGHAQGKVQRKRGRAGAMGGDGLRIVMVQPKGAVSEDPTSAASSISLISTSGPAQTACEPGLSPPSSSTATSPLDELSSTSTTGPATPAESGEQVATVSLYS
jgi:hypothetical protein